ncbi:MAG TPA: cytochrome c [Rudaea sp.]|nr:cytochrome c [Rudaea sp.]
MRPVLAVAALFGCVVCARAGAPVKPADVVHYRQSVMELVGWNFGPLAAMTKGKTAWDAKEFAIRAERIRSLSTQAIDGFTHGPADGGAETDAKPDIWNDFADFQTHLDDFINEAKTLDETARSGDEAKMKEQFHKTAATCKACHDKFKAS